MNRIMKLFGVPISYAKHEEVLALVRAFLAEPRFHRIATVNPEFLVMAERKPAFKQALISADLCVADGFGIVLVSWFQGKKITRFPGADLMHDILAIAEKEGQAVFLAIKKDGLSSYEEIRTALLKQYPQLILGGESIDVESWRSYQLKATSYKLLLCNFGAPEQELFLESLRSRSQDVRLALGVGGSFDFLTGKIPRAPLFLREKGLEWLWRLILQPKRWRRIWDAVVIFPLKVLSQK